MSLKDSLARQLFEPDQFYSAKQIRDKLGGKTHLITVHRWATSGRLPPPIKIGPNTSRWLGRDLNETLLKD
jgi:predicted DNA-binding transcriptional regulator AlpA